MTGPDARPPVSPDSRILIRLPNWVGDILMTLPALAALRAAHPDATLVGMVRPGHVALAERIDVLDEVEVAPAGRGLSRALAVWQVGRRLRRRRPDVAFILATSLEAAATAWLAGVPVRVALPTAGRGFLLTDRVAPSGLAHRSEDYLRVMARGEPISAVSDGGLRLTDADRAFATGLLSDLGWPADASVVFVNPAAAKTPRAWSADRFVRLVEMLPVRHAGLHVLVHEHHPFRAPDEWRRNPRVGVVRGATLVELAAVLERCALYVGNDSGPMHLAAALGVPTVGIYGSSSPAHTSPAPALVRRDRCGHTAVTASLPCAPCRERFFEECPSFPTPDGRPPCLDQVTVEMVAVALGRRLAAAR
jgi:heptosyltransferase-2